MTRTLTLSTGSFDQDNTFPVTAPRGLPMTCALHQGYDKEDDGVYWAMQIGVSIKSHYTDKDRAEGARLNAMKPLAQGEIVEIDGARYSTRILGNFSNAAIFDLIAE